MKRRKQTGGSKPQSALPNKKARRRRTAVCLEEVTKEGDGPACPLATESAAATTGGVELCTYQRKRARRRPLAELQVNKNALLMWGGPGSLSPNPLSTAGTASLPPPQLITTSSAQQPQLQQALKRGSSKRPLRRKKLFEGSNTPATTSIAAASDSVRYRGGASGKGGGNGYKSYGAGRATNNSQVEDTGVTNHHQQQQTSNANLCRECGMVYVVCQPEDLQRHIMACSIRNKPISFRAWKVMPVVAEYATEGARVIMLENNDPRYFSKQVLRVKSVMNKQLGWTEPENAATSNRVEKTFIYLDSQHKVLGCAVAEEIEKAYPVVAAPTTIESTKGSLEAEEEEDGCGQEEDRWRSCSTTPCAALCGISRIWVHPSSRRKSIATRLLEAIRHNFTYGYVLRKDECAFTQPTTLGHKLATTYFGTPSFLDYHEVSNSMECRQWR
ncbi:N-acetyltransferase esco2 [Balamuthia mandrillaris]